MKTSLDTHHPAAALAMTPAAGRAHYSTSESYRAQAQNSDITLTTREGDRITISQSSMSQQRRSEYSTDGSKRILEQSMAASGMSFTVQGDLNDQEVADLTALLDDLGDIAADFFSGNLGEAVSGAMNIGDMGSISKLEATFSQTRLLADYLSGPHPLPTSTGEQSGLDSNGLDPLALPSGQDMTDLLAAQWQQFLEALTSREESDSSTPTPDRRHPRHQQSQPVDHAADRTGQTMVERSKKTMTTQPRLTPLIPSVAELAIARARRQFDQTLPANQLAKDTSAAFSKAFNGWFL